MRSSLAFSIYHVNIVMRVVHVHVFASFLPVHFKIPVQCWEGEKQTVSKCYIGRKSVFPSANELSRMHIKKKKGKRQREIMQLVPDTSFWQGRSLYYDDNDAKLHHLYTIYRNALIIKLNVQPRHLSLYTHVLSALLSAKIIGILISLLENVQLRNVWLTSTRCE